jgi:DNA-binding LytR/AlgR family response regulator
MENIKCLIVDDEPIARQIVRNYCQQLPFLEVADECENALEAMNLLRQNTVQILFLDINMPVLNGLSLLKTLTQKPKVILTTAYKEYALDAFELQVSDYLLKPFSFERFLKAIQKVQAELETEQEKPIEPSPIPPSVPTVSGFHASISESEEGIFLKIGKTIFRFSYQNILFCEAQQNYTRIVTHDQDVRIYQPLSQIEEQLPPSLFLRTHRSFIVNKNKVSKIDGNRIFIGKYEVSIGANHRELFLEKLGFKEK